MTSSRILGLAAAAVLSLSGCGAHGGLAEVEKELAPEDGERATDCQELGSFVDYPSYVCTYYVPGTQAELTLRMARTLEAEGFFVKCGRGDHEEIEIEAGRDSLDVYVDVSRRDSRLGFSENDEPLDMYAPGDPYAPAWSRPIPAGTVIVRLNVSDYEQYRWPDESSPDCDRAFLMRTTEARETAGSDR